MVEAHRVAARPLVGKRCDPDVVALLEGDPLAVGGDGDLVGEGKGQVVAPVAAVGAHRPQDRLGPARRRGQLRIEDASVGAVGRAHDLVADAVEGAVGVAVGTIRHAGDKLRIATCRAHPHEVPVLVPDQPAPVSRLPRPACQHDLAPIGAPRRLRVLPRLPRQPFGRAAAGRHLPEVPAHRILPAGEGDRRPVGGPGRRVLERDEARRREAARRPVRQVHHPDAPDRLEGHVPPVGRCALPARELDRERGVVGRGLRVGELGDRALDRRREGDRRHGTARDVDAGGASRPACRRSCARRHSTSSRETNGAP